MSIKHTHTVATLEVSSATHAEITGLLRAAKYDHAFDGTMIDMTGIGLVPGAAPSAIPPSDEVIEAVRNAVAEALGEALDCTRVWSAWSHGTMRDGDFVSVAGDPERVSEIANAAIDALLATPPAPVSDGRMSAAMRSFIEGMSVSVDVSTCDADAGNRYFGTVTEVMDDDGDKHGVTLLVQSDVRANFTTLPAPVSEPIEIEAKARAFDMANQFAQTKRYRDALHAIQAAPPQAVVAQPVDLESLRDDISAIDTWYRGSPSHEYEAGWFKDHVLRLLDKQIAAQSPQAKDGDRK